MTDLILILAIFALGLICGWLMHAALVSDGQIHDVPVPEEARVKVGRGEDRFHRWIHTCEGWLSLTSEQVLACRSRALAHAARGIGPEKPIGRLAGAWLLALIASVLVVFALSGCAGGVPVSQPAPVERAAILERYRAEHGTDWDQWPEEVREQLRRDMEAAR